MATHGTNGEKTAERPASQPSHIKSQEDFFQSFLRSHLSQNDEEASEQVSASQEGGDCSFQNRAVKPHGFMRPFHPLQIASWVVFALDCLLYGFTAGPGAFWLLGSAGGTLLTLIFILLALAVIALAAVGGRLDPTDPTVYFQRECTRKGEPFPEEQFDFFCNICETHVMDGAKHCGQCNRCVERFDHHCNWLNNCVGRKNYRLFLALIWTLAAYVLFHLAVTAATLGCSFSSPHAASDFFNKIYGESAHSGVIAVCIFAILINVLVSAFTFNLIALHVYLRCKGLTTFEHILQKRERREAHLEGKRAHRKKKIISRKSSNGGGGGGGSGGESSSSKPHHLRSRVTSVAPLKQAHGRHESDIEFKILAKKAERTGCCGGKKRQVGPMERIEENPDQPESSKEQMQAFSDEFSSGQGSPQGPDHSQLELARSPSKQSSFSRRKPSEGAQIGNIIQSCSVGEADAIFSPISKSGVLRLQPHEEISHEGLGGGGTFHQRKASDSTYVRRAKKIEDSINPPRARSICPRKTGIVSIEHHKTIIENPYAESSARFSSYAGAGGLREDDGASARSGASERRHKILEAIEPLPKRKLKSSKNTTIRGDVTPRGEEDAIAEQEGDEEFDQIEESVIAESMAGGAGGSPSE